MKKLPEMNKTYLEQGVRKLINAKFQRSELFQVISEKTKYKVKEDPYLLAQSQGILPEVVEVYFNGEFLCEVYETMKPDEAYIAIVTALTAKRNRIIQSKGLYA